MVDDVGCVGSCHSNHDRQGVLHKPFVEHDILFPYAGLYGNKWIPGISSKHSVGGGGRI